MTAVTKTKPHSVACLGENSYGTYAGHYPEQPADNNQNGYQNGVYENRGVGMDRPGRLPAADLTSNSIDDRTGGGQNMQVFLDRDKCVNF